MKIFLTGATGYIGAVVAEKLVQHGHEVLGLVRSETAATTLKSRGITPVTGDLTDLDSLKYAAQKADGVIQLAQPNFEPTGNFADQMQQLGQITLAAVTTLVGTLSDSGKPLIITGGTGAYGDTGDQIVDETTPVVNLPFTAPLAQSEQRVLTAAGLAGMVIRPAIVYGRSGGPLTMLLAMVQQLGQVYYTGDGVNYLSFVHVEDLADLYLKLLEQPQPGLLVNAVAEPFVRQKELMQAISYAAGLSGVTQPMLPEMVAQMSYGGGGLFYRNMRVSAAKARALGWQPQQPNVLTELQNGSY